jgi:hypothetical protein
VAFWSLPHHFQPASAVNLMGYVSLVWFAGLSLWLFLRSRGDWTATI